MTTVAGIHRGLDTHANRPTATAVTAGTLYSCSDHSLIYISDGSTWSTYATLGSSSSGVVLQVVTATHTSNVTTSSATFVTSGLEATITPTASTSKLIVQASAYLTIAHDTVGASTASRVGLYRLYNSTDAAALAGAESLQFGRDLASASTAALSHRSGVSPVGVYTVNSTSARTFRLDIASNGSQLDCTANHASNTGLMVITEIAV